MDNLGTLFVGAATAVLIVVGVLSLVIGTIVGSIVAK